MTTTGAMAIGLTVPGRPLTPSDGRAQVSAMNTQKYLD